MRRLALSSFALLKFKHALTGLGVLLLTQTGYSQFNSQAIDQLYQPMWNQVQINNINNSIMNNNIYTAGAYGRMREEQLRGRTSPQTTAMKAKGRARISGGKATTSFKAFTTPAAVNLVLSRYKDATVTAAGQRLGAAGLVEQILRLRKEMTEAGYEPDDMIDTYVFTSGVIYEADFGKFPAQEQLEDKRQYLKKLYLESELAQGSVEYFDWQAGKAMAGAVLARNARQTLEKSNDKAEIERSVADIELLEKLFDGNMAENIYSFAGNAAGFRKNGERRTDSGFRRENHELARGWYEKEYVAKFSRTDLDYAALLKEFDSIVTGMGGATNDGADGELAAAALVYEVYLDSQKVGYQLNENHLRDLREMIARNFAQPYWSEAADIWRQRNYEQIGSRGMFVNKAYFSAKTPQQKKALADEALKVLGMVFRGKMNEYYIDANGIGRR